MVRSLRRVVITNKVGIDLGHIACYLHIIDAQEIFTYVISVLKPKHLFKKQYLKVEMRVRTRYAKATGK